jgi:hypothetical protein
MELVNPKPASIVCVLVLLGAAAPAQNRLAHFDGTREFVSRGTLNPTLAKTVIQRVPCDQARGALFLKEIRIIVQEQNVTTPDPIAVEVRTNNPAAPGTPDMSAAGLLSTTGFFVVPFNPTPIAQAVSVTVPFSGSGLPLPAPTGTPGGDWYLCVALSPAPGFPVSDGMLVGASGAIPGAEGEQMEPFSFGYTFIPNDSGLAWEYDPSTGTVAEASVNRSWEIIGRYAQDTLQPSASSPAFLGGPNGTGLNPNYGYAGIWPHLTRVVGVATDPDDLGFRYLTDLPVGTPVVLAAALFTLPFPVGVGPAALPGSAGLVLDVNFLLVVETVFTVAPPVGEPAVSQALFGPYPVGGIDGIGPLHFQAAGVVGPQVKLSTTCKVVF